MEEQNLIVVKAGKRKFAVLKSEEDLIRPLLGDDTESKTIELPELATVPEMVWRKLFPATESLPFSMMYDYLRASLYFRSPLEPWMKEFSKMSVQHVPSVSEFVDAIRCFELFLTTNPSQKQCEPVQLTLVAMVYWTEVKNTIEAVYDLYKDIVPLVQPSTLVRLLPLIYPAMKRPTANSWPSLFDQSSCFFPVNVDHLLDVHTFLPFQRLFSQDIYRSYVPTEIEPSQPLETGPVELSVFRQRFDQLSHGLCEFPAFRSMIQKQILVITGGAVAHCLSSRPMDANSFQGRDIDLFVIEDNENGNLQNMFRHVVLTLKDFIAERLPGKRMYWRKRAEAVVDVMVDDLDFTFQIIMSGHPNAAELISRFDMSARKVWYDGERVLATVDGLFAWMTGTSYLSPKAKVERMIKLKEAGFRSVTARKEVEQLNTRWRERNQLTAAHKKVYFKPLSVLPLDYNVRLLTADDPPWLKEVVCDLSEVCTWKMSFTLSVVY